MSEEVDSKAEKPFEDVYNGHIDLMNEVSKVKLHESLDVAAIIRAYKKDPNSILGITRKILK